MKRFITILIPVLLLFSSIIPAVAQQGAPEDQEERGGGDRVQAAKVAYITSKLELTTAQAQQFWPLYNEFEAARKKIRKQIRQLRVDNILLDASEDQLKTDIKKLFALRQEELDLEKLYSEKFLKVITAKQLAEYYRSEKEFTRLLIKRLKGGRGGRGRGGDDKDE
jgi:Spy/CpxP family protein refolding chaperone